MAHCIRHYEEPMEASCRTCNREFCSRCLVFAFGPSKPPYCVGCALNASGVRSGNKRSVVVEAAPEVDRRAGRAQRRAEKSQAKAETRALRRAAKKGTPIVPEAEPRTSNVPVPKGLTTPASRFAPPPDHAV